MNPSAAPAPPSTAIIVPHYNDTIRLARCLSALMPQVGPETEVVVVDNGSTDPVAPVLAPFPAVRLLHEPQKGAAHARNRGVAETTAPLLAFIDSDCVPADDWVAAIRPAAGKGDLVGGEVTVFDETPPPRSGAEAFEAVFAFDFKTYIEKKGFSGSGNLVTRRDVFETVGPFRPGLSEDLDWCHRATAAGFRLAYDPALTVSHPTRSDWAALRRKWRRVNDETWGLRSHTVRGRVLWALRAAAMPLSVLAHAPRVLASPRLSGPGERLRALGTLARLRLARMGWMLAQAGERRG